MDFCPDAGPIVEFGFEYLLDRRLPVVIVDRQQHDTFLGLFNQVREHLKSELRTKRIQGGAGKRRLQSIIFCEADDSAKMSGCGRPLNKLFIVGSKTTADGKEVAEPVEVYLYSDAARRLIWSRLFSCIMKTRSNAFFGLHLMPFLPFAVTRVMALTSQVPCLCWVSELCTAPVYGTNRILCYDLELLNKYRTLLQRGPRARPFDQPPSSAITEEMMNAYYDVLHGLVTDDVDEPEGGTDDVANVDADESSSSVTTDHGDEGALNETLWPSTDRLDNCAFESILNYPERRGDHPLTVQDRMTAYFMCFFSMQFLRHSFADVTTYTSPFDFKGQHYRQASLIERPRLTQYLFEAVGASLREGYDWEAATTALMSQLRLRTEARASLIAEMKQAGMALNGWAAYTPNSRPFWADLMEIGGVIRRFQLLELPERRRDALIWGCTLTDAQVAKDEEWVSQLPAIQTIAVNDALTSQQEWLVIHPCGSEGERASPLELATLAGVASIPSGDHFVTYRANERGSARLWTRRQYWTTAIVYGETLLHAVLGKQLLGAAPTIANALRCCRDVAPVMRAMAGWCRLRIADCPAAWPTDRPLMANATLTRLEKGLLLFADTLQAALEDNSAPLWCFLECVLPARVPALLITARALYVLLQLYERGHLLADAEESTLWPVLQRTKGVMARAFSGEPVDDDLYVPLSLRSGQEHHVLIDTCFTLKSPMTKRFILSRMRVCFSRYESHTRVNQTPPRLPLVVSSRRVLPRALAWVQILTECPLQRSLDLSEVPVAAIDQLLKLVDEMQLPWVASERDTFLFQEYALRSGKPLDAHVAIHRSHIHQTIPSAHDFKMRNTEQLRYLYAHRLPRPFACTLPTMLSEVFVNWGWWDYKS